ncbi:MAG TPA: MarR family transcriptional regulator [Pseudogracilibacillus sp.]|nr:MarR family transcriptional regulator [Pseudogracilibacillus sp.]
MRKNTRGSLIWLRMMRFTHQSNLLSNDFLKQFDLTTAQFDVLNQIAHFGPLTQSELAKRVTVTEGGISRMLSRLEKEQLIVREQNWKTKTISLTDKGEEKLTAAFDAQLTFQSSFFNDTLSVEEQKNLLKLMAKLQKYSEAKMSNM